MTNYKAFKIDDPIYGQALHLFIGSYKQYRSWVKRHLKNVKLHGNLRYAEAHSEILENEFKEKRYYIRLPRWSATIEEMGILSHELIHHVFFVLNAVGVDVDPQGKNEAFAYYYNMLFEKCMELLYTKSGKALRIGKK